MLSPGHRLGRALPLVGVVYDRLHTREIAAYAASSTHAEICRRLHGLHHGQCGPSGNVGASSAKC